MPPRENAPSASSGTPGGSLPWWLHAAACAILKPCVGSSLLLPWTVGAWLSLARAPGSGPGGRWFPNPLARPFISLESNTCSHFQNWLGFDFRSIRSKTAFLDGSSKPKPILSATSLRNATSCRILSYRSDIPSCPPEKPQESLIYSVLAPLGRRSGMQRAASFVTIASWPRRSFDVIRGFVHATTGIRTGDCIELVPRTL